MNDDQLLKELRAAGKRADEAPLPPALDAPLGALEQEQFARKILASRAAKAKPRPSRVRLLYSATAFSAFAAAAAFTFFSLRPVRG
ncbi:MAG: hypothetical protein ACHREM_32055, partial [Polyangiales bacterium]